MVDGLQIKLNHYEGPIVVFLKHALQLRVGPKYSKYLVANAIDIRSHMKFDRLLPHQLLDLFDLHIIKRNVKYIGSSDLILLHALSAMKYCPNLRLQSYKPGQ